MARTELPNGIILPAEYSDDWYDDMTSNLSKLDDVIGSDADKLSAEDVGDAALSNDYTDLDNKPDLNPYDQHLANTEIHVTSADKQKWNDNISQSYVLRYASTSVTPSSTIAYSVLNNTDNIKAGDSVIDSAGKVFLIASVDSANQTVTVSAVLLTLALDANVMHLSGNETAAGVKTFSDMSSFLGSYLGTEPSASFRTCLELLGRYDTKNKSGFYISKFRSNSAQGALSGSDVAFCTLDLLENEVRTNAILRFNLSNWSGSIPGTFSLYPKSGITSNLGLKANKWTKINGVEPGALSFPGLSSGLDISGYITDLTGGANSYTPTVDGYISLCAISTVANGAFIKQGDFGASGRDLTISGTRYAYVCLPVVKNVSADIVVVSGSLSFAKFYPCLGNV